MLIFEVAWPRPAFSCLRGHSLALGGPCCLFLGALWEGAGFLRLRPQSPGLTILLPGLPLCFRHQARGPLWGREAGLLQRLSPLEWLPGEGLKQVPLGLWRLPRRRRAPTPATGGPEPGDPRITGTELGTQSLLNSEIFDIL